MTAEQEQRMMVYINVLLDQVHKLRQEILGKP